MKFCIVFSNYTGSTFAWPGDAKYNKKFLGNREILSVLTADTAEDAIFQWKSRFS
jgi:hypothetical protein